MMKNATPRLLTIILALLLMPSCSGLLNWMKGGAPPQPGQQPPDIQQQETLQPEIRTSLEQYKRLVIERPNDAEAYFDLALAYDAVGNRALAIEAYREAVSIDPYFFEAFFNLGVDLGEAGRLDDSVDAFVNALSLRPDDFDTSFNLGVTFSRLKEYQKAVESYEKSITIFREDPEAHFNLGISYYYLNKKEEALEQYKILKDLSPALANQLHIIVTGTPPP